MDVGTGDGRFVINKARSEPRVLVIGIDAVASAMAEASRRAATRTTRGGCPNALFVVAAAEALPPELAGLASTVTVNFPWGSLLRGVLGVDPSVLRGLAGLLGPNGNLEAMVSVVERDGLAMPSEAALASAYLESGLELRAYRLPTDRETEACRTTWARRLRAVRDRPVWRIEARRSAQ